MNLLKKIPQYSNAGFIKRRNTNIFCKLKKKFVVDLSPAEKI